MSDVGTPIEEWQIISGRLPGGYDLVTPVAVHLWMENDEYVADVPALNLHAFGANQREAVRNLRARIVAEYEFLRSESDHLAPRMAAAYAALARVLGVTLE